MHSFTEKEAQHSALSYSCWVTTDLHLLSDNLWWHIWNYLVSKSSLLSCQMKRSILSLLHLHQVQKQARFLLNTWLVNNQFTEQSQYTMEVVAWYINGTQAKKYCPEVSFRIISKFEYLQFSLLEHPLIMRPTVLTVLYIFIAETKLEPEVELGLYIFTYTTLNNSVFIMNTQIFHHRRHHLQLIKMWTLLYNAYTC